MAILLGFAVVSIPLAGYTWDVLSDLISGHLTSRKALIGLPAMIVLALVVRFAASALGRLDSIFEGTPPPELPVTSDEKP